MADLAHSRRRSLPPGATVEQWTAPDGWSLRVATWEAAQGAPGSLLVAGGRGDFIEKYAEALLAWQERDYALMSFDWRGQGGSGRLGHDPLAGHAASFAPWVQDYRWLVGEFTKRLPPPHFALGHSMGGHLLLRALADGEARLDRAVLLAPMLGIATGPMPEPFARRVARWACAAGLTHAFAPGQVGPRDPAREAARQAALTGDDERSPDELWWITQHPELALGGVTYGWLASAWDSIEALAKPGVLERVETPVLTLLAGDERVVSNRAAQAMTARLPNGACEVVPNGRHELLRERDAVREAVLARIDRFLLGEAV